MTSETNMNRWNQLPEKEKKILGNNSDLLTKVFGSEKRILRGKVFQIV